MGKALASLSIIRFRWLLYELVMRDLKLRYRGSFLGVAWALLNPLLFMGVYTLVFSVILKSDIHAYPLFLLSGLIPWIWLSSGITQAMTSVSDGGAYVGKTLMPAELLVLVPVLSNGVNFAIAIALLLPLGVALGVNVGWALLFLPLLIAIELCLTLGLSLLVAATNVFYRDLQQIVTYLLTAAFFLTPIFYSRSTVPTSLQPFVALNPFAALAAAYQSLFYRGSPPQWGDLATVGAFAGIVLAAGIAYFNNTRDAFGEYV